MKEHELLLEPSEQIVIFNEKVREMMPAYFCLTASGPDGRSTARGTGVFIRRRGRAYMATAHHVLEALRDGAWVSLAQVDRHGRPLVGMAHCAATKAVWFDGPGWCILAKLNERVAELLVRARRNQRRPPTERPYQVAGSPGSGKSVAILELLDQVRARRLLMQTTWWLETATS